MEAEKRKLAEDHFKRLAQKQKDMLDHSNMANESIHEIKKASKTQ